MASKSASGPWCPAVLPAFLKGCAVYLSCWPWCQPYCEAGGTRDLSCRVAPMQIHPGLPPVESVLWRYWGWLLFLVCRWWPAVSWELLERTQRIYTSFCFVGILGPNWSTNQRCVLEGPQMFMNLPWVFPTPLPASKSVFEIHLWGAEGMLHVS